MLGVGGSGLDQLEQAATALLAESELVAPDFHAALAFLKPLRTQINRCELAFARASARLEESLQEGEHSLTAIQTLREECGMASGAAGAAATIGEQEPLCGEGWAAVEAGRMGLAHLALLAQAAEFVGDGFDPGPLVAKAEEVSVSAFGRICAHARHAARPDGFIEEERRGHDARFLELSTKTSDGSVYLRGLLDAEGGAYLRTAVAALSQPLPDEMRSAGQRRADALVEISRLVLDEGRVPERGGVRPHVQVTATLETLLGLPGAPAAELEGSGPVSLETLRRIAGDCSLRRLLLDEDSLVIDVGRERRLYRGGSRFAIDARDGGCVWPGCSREPRFCQVDHEVEWWQGGETTAANGRLLCRYHHRLKSEGWRLTHLSDQDRWVATPPFWILDHREWQQPWQAGQQPWQAGQQPWQAGTDTS
jgi:hypothetical protein